VKYFNNLIGKSWEFFKSGIVVGEERANLNDQLSLSGIVLLAYLPKADRNKAGVLWRVFEIQYCIFNSPLHSWRKNLLVIAGKKQALSSAENGA
jgi:hypothetical protein